MIVNTLSGISNPGQLEFIQTYICVSILLATSVIESVARVRQHIHDLLVSRYNVKVVYSCRIFSTKWSDTFISFFVYEKEQEPRNKICHNRAKDLPS